MSSAQIPSANTGKLVERPSITSLIRTSVFLFSSTTPALGIPGIALTVASLIALLFVTVREHIGKPFTLLFIFLILILPITLYDLLISLDRGFVTASFIAIPLLVIAGFVFSQSSGPLSFMDLYERAFFCLAVPSFVLFIFFILNPSIAYSLPEYEFRETFNHTALLLNIQMNPDPVLRNAGFASEPGFYQLMVNTALYARLRRLGNPDRISIFYLVVALSTLSTTGIAVSFFLVTLKFDIKYRILLVIFALAFLSGVQELLISQYNSKILNEDVFGPRIIPSLNALSIFGENILGIGAVEYTNTYQRLDIGSWDSYTQIAMRYGLPGLAGFAMLMIGLLRRHPVLAGMFALSFITSPIWFLPAICAFYFPNERDSFRARRSDGIS